MTDEQMGTLERLWADGVPIKAIARQMHLHPMYVQKVIASDRKRYPYRYTTTDRHVRSAAAAKVISGKSTPREMAETLGTSIETVRRWVRMERSKHDRN